MELRVKQICKEKGILFKDLAAAVGVHDVTLRSSLQGNPTIGTLEKVATALGVSVPELSPLNRRTQSPARIAANLSKWRRENSNGDAGALHIFLSGVARLHPYIGDATCNPRYIDRKLWNYNLSKARYTKYEASG